MHYVIYKIKNTANNKIYIGKHQTDNLNDGYMGSGKHLLYSQNKYGLDKFKKEILYEFETEEEMNDMEREIVNEEFIARLDTYNIMQGGNGGWNYINKNNLNTKNHNTDKYKKSHQKIVGYMRKIWKEKWDNDSEFQRKTIEIMLENRCDWFGRHHTKETKEKISKAKKGKYKGKENSQYGTCWIMNKKLKENKKIKKEDLQDWINEGWTKGRKII